MGLQEMRDALGPKKGGFGLDVRVFHGKSGNTYVVYRTRTGAVNVFVEVEARAAAIDCGASVTNRGPQAAWKQIWR